MQNDIIEAMWTLSFADVVKQFSLDSEVAGRMNQAYQNLVVPEGIETYGDEALINTMPGIKILVTSGYTTFQTSKIEQLGIAPMFDDIIIDAIDDPATRIGKQAIFERALLEYEVEANETWVIGDSGASELSAAKHLGIPCVQTLRPGIERYEPADQHVSDFHELAALLGG